MGLFFIIFTLIIFLISGFFIYGGLDEIQQFNKENCYLVKGKILHIECKFIFNNKCDSLKYGDYEGKTINMDRIPGHESLVPVVRKATGVIKYRPVYTYYLNGEEQIYTERNDKYYHKFKRNKYYKGVEKTLLVNKKTGAVYVDGYGGKNTFLVLGIALAVLGMLMIAGLIIGFSGGWLALI